MKLSPNFDISEFQSKDGSEFPDHVINNLRELALNLQVLRDELNAPIEITSGYRSPKHNRRVGGAKNSFHVSGQAGDIKVKGHTPQQVYDTIERLISEGKMKQGGLGLYRSWIHYDIRGYRARW